MGVAVFLVLNTVVSEFAVRRQIYSWESAIGQFIATVIVNGAIVFGIRAMLPRDRLFNLNGALFFVSLLSVLIALYDWYRPIYLTHFGDSRRENPAAEVPSIPNP